LTFKCDLDRRPAIGNVGSAHPLVEVNISAKFEENPSIGKGFKERTKIQVKI